jgi:O-antigen/teichoic acid export membrane protein
MATVQHVGAVLVLWLISPSILTFFSWQILISIVQTLLLARSVWLSLPIALEKTTFQSNLLRKNWRFAAGMTGISIMALILTQTDKILLSKVLTLTTFGYYMLAFNLANAVSQLVSPVFLALFPKLSQLIATKGTDNLISEYYHKGCQLVSIIVLPVAGILTLFSFQVLYLWVRDPVIAQNTYLLLSLLVAGSTLNALMTLPLSLQLAHGWTRLSFIKNVFAVIIYVPLLLWLVSRYGAKGAAVVWIALNASYFVIEIPVMHHRMLKHDMWPWYLRDVGVPALIAYFLAALSRLLMPESASIHFTFWWIVVTAICAMLFSSLSTPLASDWMKKVNII